MDLTCHLELSKLRTSSHATNVNMTAWVHKECNGIEEEAITKLQEAWDSLEQKLCCLQDETVQRGVPGEG